MLCKTLLYILTTLHMKTKNHKLFISKKSHFLNMKGYRRVNKTVGSCGRNFKFSINVTASVFNNIFIIQFSGLNFNCNKIHSLTSHKQ